MPELDQINNNLKDLASANELFLSSRVVVDRRLTEEKDHDLAHATALLKQIQECRKGICQVTWRPNR
jgi:hypothetical protein